MDIERYKKLTIPKIESGKITQIVRDVIKDEQKFKEEVYEERKEDLRPITKQLKKEINEISELRKEYNQQQALPAPVQQALPAPVQQALQEPVQQQALQEPVPPPRTKKIIEKTKMVANMDNPETGVYGNLIIDLPKLYGKLRLVAKQNGKKVYDK